MADYPTVTLPHEVIVQPATVTNTFNIIQIAENPNEMWVNAFVSGAPQSVWVPVLNKDNYFADWTDQTVIDAVIAWAESAFPPAPGA
jgi:hypothetical protein